MRPIAALLVVALVTAPAGLSAQDARSLPPPGWGGDGDAFAGTLSCRSQGGRERICDARTNGRVQLLQVERGRCREGADWDFNRTRIRVRNGCAARFGYGYAGGARPPAWNNDFAGTIACATYDRRQQRCFVRTDDRVQLLQDRSGRCVAGSTWGYTRDFVWVSNRCAGEFGYGFRGGVGRPDRPNDGPSTGAIIGGVAVAAGLLALLASSRKKKSGGADAALPGFPPGPPAAIQADPALFPAAARAAGQACLFEAARQIGETGGTRLRLDRVGDVRRTGNGWHLRAEAQASYPDGEHATPFTCRATAEQVLDLSFTG